MIKKFILAIIAMAVMALGLTGISVSATAIAPSATTASVVSATDGPSPDVRVIKSKAKAKAKKYIRCLVRAAKRAAPTRPVDPRAHCKGKLKKRLRLKAAVWCPEGYFGGKASATVFLNEIDLWDAFSQTFEPGNTSVRTESVLDMAVSGKAQASTTCYPNHQTPGPTPTTTPTVPPTPTPTPPVVPGPQLLEVDTINDVLINNSRYITVVGTVAAGHSATLFATANNGGSITSGKTQQVSGMFTVKVTYKAPSEVPPGGHDWVSFTLTQDDGQVAKITTNQFVIKVPQVDDPL